MANNLGSLVVSLGLDAAEFTRGLSKSEYQTQQWVRRFETGIEAARTGALAAFATMGTAAAVLDRQLNDIAGFQDLADKMGDTAQEVASLKLAADLSGTALDTMAGASVKLTAALAKTDDESKGVGAALKSIGLEFDEFKRLAPVAQIDAVAQALAGFEDGAGKTAVAVQLFGKSGADLIPMLNDLAETGGRQVSLTQQQIQAADDYSKATARLRSEVQSLVQVTAADAAPVMLQIVQILRDTVQYSTSAAGGVNLLESSMRGVKTALEAVLVVGSDVAYVFKTIGDTAGAYAAVSAALIRGDIDGAKAIGAAYREMSAERRKALDGYQAGVLGTGASYPQASYSNEGRNYTPQPRAINFTPVVTGNSKAASEAARAAQEAERAAREYDTWLRSLTDAENEYRLKKLDERIQAQKTEEQTYADWLRGLEEATVEGGAKNYIRRLDEQRQEMEKTKSFAKEMGLSFTSAFEDAIVGGKKFSDVLKGLEQDLLRIVVRKSITEPLGNWITSALPSLFGGGKAIGGGVSGGTSYLVGERGPELFTPATSGRITPSGSMGVTVNVINQTGQAVDARQSSRTGADGSQIVDVVMTLVGDALASRSGPVARGLENGYGLRPAMA
jgi:hypothetical protein